MSDLRDDLMDIQGVGEATADSILDVLSDHDTEPDSPTLERAVAYAREGEDRRAAMLLRRYADE